MNILHAATDPDLLTRLKDMLGSSARADIAVGYFFMSGFEAVADDLARLDKVRVLVGRADRRVLDEVALGIQQAQALRARLDADSLVRRRQRAEIARQAVAHVAEGVSALPQARGTQDAVAKLRDMIASGKMEARAYLRSPLHAKAYLCWYDNHAEPGAAVVGSSNFTLAGFMGNTELNVRVTGDAEMSALRDWFDALWNDSEDISGALADALERSWALAKTPPYHVYLKALRELYQSDVGGAPLPLSKPPIELANFQIDAVSRALAMIEAHGGCYVGDVVGLGKTFIGAELLRQLRVSYPQDGPPLILCPARLKPMWNHVNEQFGLGAAVVSHSAISAPPDAEFDEELGRYVDAESPSAGRGVILEREYPNRGPVLVDEAHNFRNVNQRSTGLRRYLESGRHKVALLSATPQNLGPKDIYRQLRLFLDETDHGLNIEPIGLEDYFRCAERWHKYRAEFENYEADFQSWQAAGSNGAPPLPPDRPSEPRADVEQALTPVFIRRRRKDIAELYGDTATIGGSPVRFPKPVLSNVSYRLDKVYAKAGGFAELNALLKSHKAARYKVTDFIKPEAMDNAKYRDLFRARDRVARLMGVLLLKRLESSIEAFRSTLKSLIRSNRNFRQALEEGYVPIGDTATRLLAGEAFDADETLHILRQEEDRRRQAGAGKSALVHPTADFEIADWIEAIDADHATLSEMLRRVEGISPEDDDKLRALKRFMDDPDVKSGKVLIFSEAETTVEYLYRQLNPNGADPRIARLTGAARGSAESVVRRFSPTWNQGRADGSEIRVLLATDIVSEGQNLQDCARILNYDLHWNPVRLIQRFGRIDRIGSEHDEINLHNMWPDTEVDANIDLTGRLHNRIQSFHNLIGLDSKLLSDSERLNETAMYRIYDDKELPDMDDGLDEVAANQRAIALLQRIRDDDPDLWDTIANLPDGIRSALQAQPERSAASSGGGARAEAAEAAIEGAQGTMPIEGAQPPLMSPSTMASAPSPFDEPRRGETIVLLSEGDFEGCYAVGSDLQPRAISPAQFVAAAECVPDTPSQPLPQDTNERVMAAFELFRADSSKRLGRSRIRVDSSNRRYVSRQLNIARERLEDAEKPRVEVLRRIFLASVSPQVESALTEIRNTRIEGHGLIRRLEALRERHRLNPPEDSERDSPREPRIIRIVCSDGLA